MQWYLSNTLRTRMKGPFIRCHSCRVYCLDTVLLRNDCFQLFGLDDLAVEACILATAAAGHNHQRRAVHDRYPEIGLVLLVDVVLVDLDNHLADRTGVAIMSAPPSQADSIMSLISARLFVDARGRV